ncbi:PEK protein kinase [Exophiala aquamarina CBS 119918]|uniref:PEK protein kinase n=1 Tax=Exophiala aquamarina CBS 119918 TaxID=1182545 RepID=A0A072P837_9EURO|nr:PEK protein kinase [Exophiala aquamarina CBS 119918]KEF55448.1 PEK protein kinase [Exophiala aquamarina CBS 119918]
MSSAFFRRPTDESSSSDSDDAEPAEDSQEELEISAGEEVGPTITTESLSSHESVSVGGEGQEVPFADFHNIEQHRSLLLSALLEDFVKNRACEEMNKANPGRNYDRHSPEIQPLAQRLFQQASQPLALNGWITPTAANDNIGSRQTRATYLSGIESLALGRLQSGNFLPGQGRPQLPSRNHLLALTQANHHNQMTGQHNLAAVAGSLSLFSESNAPPSPYSDLILTSPTVRRSHYESSFQQLKFLGRGGFGAVYHTYNVFDKKEYAVKKIPLSPRLSQRYRESGHKELESILREVQALAQLEHNNIVRYHATWIEEPKETASMVYTPRKPSLTVGGRRLIEAVGSASRHLPPAQVSEVSDGIIFGSDSVSKAVTDKVDVDPPAPSVTFAHPTETESIAGRTSEIFTDGDAQPGARVETVLDSSVYVLHVQMSVYPLTLAQYLAPQGQGHGQHQHQSTNSGSLSRRHCFHLVPALRILLGILCGLQYIHAKGLIHRDIKPTNIFMSSMELNAGSLIAEGYHDVGSCVGCEGSSPYYINPRIGDFGLVAEPTLDSMIGGTGNRRVVGTQYYRPPPFRDARNKCNSNAVVDEKLDVFALGVILVEMLWCCRTATERMHVLQGLQRGKIPSGLPEKLKQEGHEPETGELVLQGISSMIERDPSKRWGCAALTEWIVMILDKCKPPPTHDLQ